MLHYLLRSETGLPTHQKTSQVAKRGMSETLGEKVTQLVFGVNLHNAYPIGFVRDMGMEPVVLDGIVL